MTLRVAEKWFRTKRLTCYLTLDKISGGTVDSYYERLNYMLISVGDFKLVRAGMEDRRSYFP